MKPSQSNPIKEDSVPMVIIPLEEASDVLSIRVAALYVDDGNRFWLETMPQIIATYHLTPNDYWDLTVAEHQMLHTALQQPEASDGG